MGSVETLRQNLKLTSSACKPPKPKRAVGAFLPSDCELVACCFCLSTATWPPSQQHGALAAPLAAPKHVLAVYSPTESCWSPFAEHCGIRIWPLLALLLAPPVRRAHFLKPYGAKPDRRSALR